MNEVLIYCNGACRGKYYVNVKKYTQSTHTCTTHKLTTHTHTTRTSHTYTHTNTPHTQNADKQHNHLPRKGQTKSSGDEDRKLPSDF